VVKDVAVGPDLDALVASQVMGIPEVNGNFLFADGLRSRKELPCYSTDIAAAWQVVDTMRERGHPWVFLDLLDGGVPGVPEPRWCAGFDATLDQRDCARRNLEMDGEGDGDTPAVAICRAALKAVANAA